MGDAPSIVSQPTPSRYGRRCGRTAPKSDSLRTKHVIGILDPDMNDQMVDVPARRPAVLNSLAWTVPSHLAHLVMRLARESGVQNRGLAGLPGLAPCELADDLARPSTFAVARVWEQFSAAVPNGGAGLRAAEAATIGSLHVWDYLFTTGPTLADGARRAAEHFHLFMDPAVTMEVEQDGQLLTINYSCPVERMPDADGIQEFITALLLRRCREATGRELAPVRAGFVHPAPRTHRHLTEAFGTSHVDFAEPVNSLTFLLADTTTAPSADPHLAEILTRHAATITASVRPTPDWRDRFDDALAMALRDAVPSLREVAQRLAITPRTLQRRLAQQHTTWQQELDRARCQRAAVLLGEAELPRDAVAKRLGYADPRSLRRALQRWSDADPPGSATEADGERCRH